MSSFKKSILLAAVAIAGLFSAGSNHAQAQDASIPRTYHVAVVKVDYFSGGTWTQNVISTESYSDAIFMYNLLEDALEAGVINELINTNWRSGIIDVTFRTDFNIPIMQANHYLSQTGIRQVALQADD